MYEGYKKLLVEKCEKVLKITFNNPAKKNALNVEAYKEIGKVLRAVAKDDSVAIVVFTGAGNFFTAGNDLSAMSFEEDLSAQIKKANTIFEEMVLALIECPKITFALVNGPAIGIGATLAGLCDLVWCTEQAYFLTPFTKLGIVPEACSSYLFPLILGRSKATEMLLLNEKLSSKEAYERGFVSKIYKQSDVKEVVWAKIKEWSELPPNSLMQSKYVMRSLEKTALFKSLDLECEELSKRFYSDEFFNAVLKFSSRKNKSKL